MAVQIFRGAGRRSILIYLLYGVSGSRTDPRKKAHTLRMLRSVARDAAMRGGIAAMIAGDMNLEIRVVPGYMREMATYCRLARQRRVGKGRS